MVRELLRKIRPFIPGLIEKEYQRGLRTIQDRIFGNGRTVIIQGYSQDSLKLSRRLEKHPLLVTQTSEQKEILNNGEGILEAEIYLFQGSQGSGGILAYQILGEISPYNISFEIIARDGERKVIMNRSNGTLYQAILSFEDPNNRFRKYVGEIIEVDYGKSRHGGVLVLESLIEPPRTNLNTSPTYKENENKQ